VQYTILVDYFGAFIHFSYIGASIINVITENNMIIHAIVGGVIFLTLQHSAILYLYGC